MRIKPTESYTINSNHQAFTAIRTDRYARRVINHMPAGDIAEFNQIKESLSKTKHWDLKLSGTGRDFKNFIFSFVNKEKKGRTILDNITPYMHKNDSIVAYTTIKQKEGFAINTVETLKYNSPETAKTLFDTYEQNCIEAVKKHWVLTPLENLKNHVIQLKMLEEATQNSFINNRSSFVNSLITTKDYIGNGYK